jgi:hypothetical protein
MFSCLYATSQAQGVTFGPRQELHLGVAQSKIVGKARMSRGLVHSLRKGLSTNFRGLLFESQLLSFAGMLSIVVH